MFKGILQQSAVGTYLTAFCENHALIAVYLYTLLITGFTEVIIYHFSYARADTRKLDLELSQIERTLKDKLDSGDYKDNEIDQLSSQFKDKTAELSRRMILPNLVSLPIMLMSTAFVMRNFSTTVIGELPFEPFNWVRFFVSRGVQNDNPRAMSLSFWYFLCVSFNGALLKALVSRIRQPGVKDITSLPTAKPKRD